MHYFFRPFFRENVIFAEKIRKIKFVHFSTRFDDPFIQCTSTKFPYFSEFRISGLADVSEILDRFSEVGSFKVKGPESAILELQKKFNNNQRKCNYSWQKSKVM